MNRQEARSSRLEMERKVDDRAMNNEAEAERRSSSRVGRQARRASLQTADEWQSELAWMQEHKDSEKGCGAGRMQLTRWVEATAAA
jgi:hypothetical protein